MDRKTISLIEKAKQQDEKAFDELCLLYYKRIYFIALRLTNCDADAQDVVQETFLQLQASLHTLKEVKTFDFWLRRIILSKCNRIFRKNHYPSSDPQIYANDFSFVEKRVDYLPKESMDKETSLNILMQMIDRLPYMHKEILLLQYFEQYNNKEIAKLLGIHENTVKSRAFNARKRLKEEILLYEEENDMKFSFHSKAIGGILTVAYLSSFGTSVGQGLGIGVLVKNTIGFLQANAVQSALVVSLCITGSVGGKWIYDTIQENKEVEPLISLQKQEINFPIVHYKDEIIKNSRDAYYTLVLWANTEEQMEVKTIEDIQAIQVVFEALQESNSIYYQNLIRIGWVTLFEHRIQSL